MKAAKQTGAREQMPRKLQAHSTKTRETPDPKFEPLSCLTLEGRDLGGEQEELRGSEPSALRGLCSTAEPEVSGVQSETQEGEKGSGTQAAGFSAATAQN